MIEIITALFGVGGIGTFIGSCVLYYRSNKRKNEAQATIAEAHAIKAFALEWKAIADDRDVKLDQKDIKIESLYVVINDWRDKYNLLLDENQTNRLESKKYEFLACNRRACQGREPKTGY